MSSDQMKPASRRVCCCGPGKRRYLLPLLCTTALTIVIGMRSEMLSIISYISSNASSSGSSSKEEVSYIFKPSSHRQLPWTPPSLEDFIENAFFVANIVASPLGGYLTINHDPSLLLGSSVAMTCGLNLFLPLAATIGGDSPIRVGVVIFLRILQGLAEGCLIPAIFGLIRFWAPVTERSSIVCFSVIGVSLGPLIGLPVCLAIEQRWGWGVVFYIYANLGLLWCIFWWRLVDERPGRSKSISVEEREYILAGNTSIDFHDDVQDGVRKSSRALVPWREMLRSRAIYAILVTYAADDWTFQITSVCMQSYFETQYNSDIDRTIHLLIYPFLARSIFVPIGGLIADLLGYSSSLPWTTIRKILTGIGFGLKGIFFVAMAFSKNEMTAIIMLSLCLGFSGIAVAGYAVNVLEIAPNYAGLIMGIASSVSTFAGIASTVVASLMVYHVKDHGWLIALCSAGAIQFLAAAMYLWFGTSQPQSWAAPASRRQSANSHDEQGPL